MVLRWRCLILLKYLYELLNIQVIAVLQILVLLHCHRINSRTSYHRRQTILQVEDREGLLASRIACLK